jgi:hypothetical protein
MVRTQDVRMTPNEAHSVVRPGLMNASLVGVTVLRRAVTSVELPLGKALIMKMREIMTIY